MRRWGLNTVFTSDKLPTLRNTRVGNFIRRLQFLVMLSGVIALFLNLVNPKIAQESKKTLTHALGKVNEGAKSIVSDGNGGNGRNDGNDGVGRNETSRKVESEDRYVWIDGKQYKFNPRHVYNVDGVPTYYKVGKPEQIAKPGRGADHSVGRNEDNPRKDIRKDMESLNVGAPRKVGELQNEENFMDQMGSVNEVESLAGKIRAQADAVYAKDKGVVTVERTVGSGTLRKDLKDAVEATNKHNQMLERLEKE
jgi:hypothetical protein